MRFFLLLLAMLHFASGVVKSVTTSVKNAGQIRYHYDDTTSSVRCQTLMLVGVGTAMSVTDYDLLGASILAVDTNIVFVMLDHSVRSINKQNPSKFAKLANAVTADLANQISACSSSTPSNIIIGGHSSSGQAAAKALNQTLLSFDVAGFLGLDPFFFPSPLYFVNHLPDKMDNISVPSIMFGFTASTCWVDINIAAKRGYEITSSDDHKHVFFRFNNSANDVRHCCFTNSGCQSYNIVGLNVGVCSPGNHDGVVRQVVGIGVRDFVVALNTNAAFDRTTFPTPDTPCSTSSSCVSVDVFVGSDKVQDSTTAPGNIFRRLQRVLSD